MSAVPCLASTLSLPPPPPPLNATGSPPPQVVSLAAPEEEAAHILHEACAKDGFFYGLSTPEAACPALPMLR